MPWDSRGGERQAAQRAIMPGEVRMDDGKSPQNFADFCFLLHCDDDSASPPLLLRLPSGRVRHARTWPSAEVGPSDLASRSVTCVSVAGSPLFFLQPILHVLTALLPSSTPHHTQKAKRRSSTRTHDPGHTLVFLVK